MLGFIFPGQGSQIKGMGRGLFDEVREYAAYEKQVDAIVGYSMRKLCLEDPNGQLKQTQYTQPSLYVVNALHYYSALVQGLRPAYLAGHSLGEYNALHAAGAFDFLTGLRLVKKRGELMSQTKDGGMAAVIGLGVPAIANVLEQGRLTSIAIANFNSPSQTVLSGSLEDINRAGPLLQRAGVQMYIPLPVSAAFHSPHVAKAAAAFADFLAPFEFVAPKLPVIANATAEPYPSTDASRGIKSLLTQQITSSVQWTDSVRYLLSRGVTGFKEIGPGNVLTRLVHQIQQNKAA